MSGGAIFAIVFVVLFFTFLLIAGVIIALVKTGFIEWELPNFIKKYLFNEEVLSPEEEEQKAYGDEIGGVTKKTKELEYRTRLNPGKHGYKIDNDSFFSDHCYSE